MSTQSQMSTSNKSIVRIFAAFLIVFFLIITLLTAFLVVPQINQSLETQHIADSEITLEIETELFKRFVSNHHTTLKDLAKFPVVTSAALLSQSDNPDFIDLLNNFSIAGQKSRLMLKNIDGDVIYQTTRDMKGDFSPEAPWIKALLEGQSSYHFQLLEQAGDHFSFALSVPVIYRGHTEGILSAEITTPLTALFSQQTIKEGGAFTIRQGNVVVKTNTDGILIPHEVSTDVVEKNIEITYISDDTRVLQAQNKLRNMILAVLFVGLLISFVLFSLLGYQTLLGKDQDNMPRQMIWSRSYSMPIIITVIGVAASVSAYLFLTNLQDQKNKQGILASNRAQILSIENSINNNLELLRPLKGFFDASQHIDRGEFNVFVQPLLKRYNDIQALEWVPNIPNAKRDDYEEQAKKDGFGDFEITERDESGDIMRALEREAYFPVYYVEPMQGNEKALGFDLGSNPRRLAAINQAKDTGRPVATSRITLVQDNTTKAGFLVFNPVYEDVNFTTGASIKGFVLAVINANDIIQNALGDNLEGINIFAEDVTDSNNPEVIFGAFDPEKVRSDLISTVTIDVAGRAWKLRAFPVANMVKQASWMSWAVLLGGLLFTFFIAYTFIQLIHRRKVIEHIVRQRTKEVRELSSAMENAVEGVSQINTSGKYIYLNEAYAGACGYKPEELAGKPWDITVHKDDHEMMNEAYQFMIDTGKVVEEPRGVRKDGSVFYKRVTMISQYNENGDFIGHHCFMSDISDKKTAEQEILRSNIELERFAYVASHDLQEPLRMVTNFTGLLEKRYGEKLDDTAKEYIAFAANGARRMQDLVNDLLDYARIGQDAESFKDVNMNRIMGMIEENLKDSIDTTGAIITYDELPVLYSSPIRLMRVLQNLIGNSIKYQEAGVKPEVHISAVEKSGMWEISIKDNGIGMKQEYCEKIFEPFKRLHAKNEYNGTGMGLAICRKIIEGFGGDVWAESTIGEGSTFVFTMPVHTNLQEAGEDDVT